MSSPIYRIGDYYLDWYGNRPNLYVHYRDATGTQRVSTRTADKDAAIRFLKQFVEGVEAPEDPDQITVRELVGLHTQARGKMQRQLKPVLQSDLADMRVRDIRQRHVDAFVRSQVEGRGIMESSSTTYLVAFKAVLNWAHRGGGPDDEPLIQRVPPFTFTHPSQFEPRERWLTREEVDQWLELIRSCGTPAQQHVATFVRLALATAARPATVLRLRWEQVQWESNLIDLRDPLERKRVGNKLKGTVPIGKGTRRFLEALHRDSTSPYLVNHLGSPVKCIHKGTVRTAADADLGHVTPYVLRHTAAVWMARQSVPIERIAEYLGHRNLETTRRHYLKHYPGYLADAADAVDLG